MFYTISKQVRIRKSANIGGFVLPNRSAPAA